MKGPGDNRLVLGWGAYRNSYRRRSNACKLHRGRPLIGTPPLLEGSGERHPSR